jgi:hypothetical protein
MTAMRDDVFSREVQRRTGEGMTFSQMEAKTREIGGKEGVLTAAWWNKVAIGETAPPPAPKCIPGVAGVLEVDERHVALLICEEWYGVRPDDYVRDLVGQTVDGARFWVRSRISSARERRRRAAIETEG